MKEKPTTEDCPNESAHHRPILCRTLCKETGIAIEAMVAAGLFSSVAQGLGLLAQEGLASRLKIEPRLQETINLYRQMRELSIS